MSVGERWETVKKYRYCFNCLAHSHMKDKCTSRERCIECMSEHHTLLHRHKVKKGHKPAAQQQTHTSGSPKDQNSTKRRRNKNKKRGTPKKVATQPQQHHCCSLPLQEQPQHYVQPQQQQYQQQQPQHYVQPAQQHYPQQQLQPYQQQPPYPYGQQHQTPATIVINVMSSRIV
ncbi:50 kDa gamma-zein-like [Lucilia sericata]|uniref:50 kDa gamma-zein-like n=1 Tax=Lucilia sericata TaxID=13632 RepID=UPI0018A882DF|nr:50 kDa gamma-zein-like [Lucilia sericata]